MNNKNILLHCRADHIWLECIFHYLLKDEAFSPSKNTSFTTGGMKLYAERIQRRYAGFILLGFFVYLGFEICFRLLDCFGLFVLRQM